MNHKSKMFLLRRCFHFSNTLSVLFFSSHFVSLYGVCVAHIVSFIAVLVEHQTKNEYTNIHTQHRQLKRCATRNTPKICSG